MKAKDIPNLITVLRILLVVPILLLLLQRQFAPALWLIAIAGLSDWIDGYLARRNNWHSAMGALLDPLADKLLLISLYLVLSVIGLLPAWLAALVVGRDVIILAGAGSYYRLFGNIRIEPTWSSKTNTFFQIALILWIMLSQVSGAMPTAVSQWLMSIVVLTTLSSGAQYVWIWSRRARQQARESRDE